MSGEGELPAGWKRVRFEQLVENLDGRRVPVRSTDRAERPGPYPYYGASGVIDHVDAYLFEGEHLLIAEDGANLLSRSTPIAFKASGRFWVNNHAHVVRPLNGAPTGYLEAFLNSIDLAPHVTGSAQPKLTQKALNRIEVPVAPIAEQHLIVGKLGSLHGRSARAREALDAVPPLLEKLRQSILAAAFRGDLTKDWRAQNPDVEPASELLKRIRVERRKKWEEAELAKMAAKGKVPAGEAWKAKYKEPEPVDAAGLQELPEGWCWASLEELAVDGPTNGISPPSEAGGDGTPTLKLSATTSGRCILDASTTKRTAVPLADPTPYWLRPGDLLIQRANTLEKVGVSAVYDGPPDTYIYPDLMMRVRLGSLLASEQLWRALSWEHSRAYLKARATGTAGNMPKVNGEVVRSVPIPLAPEGETALMLARIRSAEAARVGSAERVGQLADTLGSLGRAVLAAAFRGELVAPGGESPPQPIECTT